MSGMERIVEDTDLSLLFARRLQGGPEGPTTAERYYGRCCAEVLLASDWLAARDARVRAEALAPIEVVCAECRDRAAMEAKG